MEWVKICNFDPKALESCSNFRACLHRVGDPGLVGLVSSVFTLWGTQNKTKGYFSSDGYSVEGPAANS